MASELPSETFEADCSCSFLPTEIHGCGDHNEVQGFECLDGLADPSSLRPTEVVPVELPVRRPQRLEYLAGGFDVV